MYATQLAHASLSSSHDGGDGVVLILLYELFQGSSSYDGGDGVVLILLYELIQEVNPA